MRMSDLANTGKTAATGQSATPSALVPAPSSQDRKWLLLDSKLLEGEHILLVFEKRWLTEARQTYPGKVIYFPLEVEELKRVKDHPETIKFLHRIKKEFGAWIVPSNRPSTGR